MVTRPHGQYQTHVGNAVNGKYLYCILYWQIPVPVKGYKQKRRYPQYFPANEKSLQIAGKYSNIVAEVKEKYRVKKTFISSFTMKVIAAVDGDQKREQGADK